MDRKNVAKLSFSVVALSFTGMAFFAMFGPEGCGPSEEDRQLLFVVNNLSEIVEKGGHVDAVKRVMEEDDDDDGDRDGGDVYRFEGEILNSDNVAIGRVRGGRVEGFGTMRPRVQWYTTPGVPEEWQGRSGWRDRQRRDREGGERPEGRGGEERPNAERE
jgi:hypothetical protein